ncbi:hypothetical protein [Ruegeria sp. SCP11]|uniref:hypothetical protein n=1 Tax=Ruegeria sp. SCP11 TaxID=3141378 RepID=UPI003335E6E7
MTRFYDWNPMPHHLAVRCPSCNAEAKFEFAETVRIKLKKDVDFFQKSTAFEYRLMENTGHGSWHAAIYYHGLCSSDMSDIKDLPDDYRPEDWRHSKYLYRSHGLDIGTVVCRSCLLRRKHDLIWPDDAYFQIEHNQHTLWAYDRETVSALIDYIGSRDRRKTGNWGAFLRHVPSRFLQARARQPVLKKLDSLLRET